LVLHIFSGFDDNVDNGVDVMKAVTQVGREKVIVVRA